MLTAPALHVFLLCFGDLIYVFFANRKIGDLIYVLTLFFAETQYDGLANTLFFSKKKKKTSADG